MLFEELTHLRDYIIYSFMWVFCEFSVSFSIFSARAHFSQEKSPI